jgi:hypothetical protein
LEGVDGRGSLVVDTVVLVSADASISVGSVAAVVVVAAEVIAGAVAGDTDEQEATRRDTK